MSHTQTLLKPTKGGEVWFSFNGNRLIVSEPWDNDEESVAAVAMTNRELRQLAQQLLALVEHLDAMAEPCPPCVPANCPCLTTK